MFRRGPRRDDKKRGGKSRDADKELEDKPEDLTADLESQAADYLADNDVWMYGPNAEAVLEILDRLEEMGPDEARPLAQAWSDVPESDRERARRAARKLAENDEEIARHLQLAREAVGTWTAVKGPYPEFVNADPDWKDLCARSGEAAIDAATAVILEEHVQEHHHEVLLQPWSETIALLDASADAAKGEGAGKGKSGGKAKATPEDADEDEEEEPEGKFGPNSDAVEDFLNRLWVLPPEQEDLLAGSWQKSDAAARKAAHADLRAVVDEDREWRDQVRRAQEELVPWLNAGRLESRKLAGPPLADAVAALVLGDLLVPRNARTLYAPWFNLVGAPPLPRPSPTSKAGGTPRSSVPKKK